MTELRKEINKEKWDKLLLKEASLFQIVKQMVKRLNTRTFWGIVSVAEFGIIIWVKL